MRVSLMLALLAPFLPMYAVDPSATALDPDALPADAASAAPAASAPAVEPAPEGNGDAADAGAPSSDDGQKESSDAASASSTEVGSAEAPNADASPAESSSESDTSSSAQSASPAADTADADTSLGDTAGDPTPAVAIDVEDHAEAKERFAGLMARLHRFENEAVAELKEDLKAIATLLHLHTVASGKAESTGDYASDDL